jgi:RNase H
MRYWKCKTTNTEEHNEDDENEGIRDYLRKKSRNKPGAIQIEYINQHLLESENINEMCICSDGGVREGKGGFGIVLAINKTTILKGYKRIRKTFNDLTSYRAEAIGVLAALYTYLRIQQFRATHQIEIPNNILTIICDNEAVVNMINILKRNEINQKMIYKLDMDIFMEIKYCLGRIKKNIKFQHVKGHQDKSVLPLMYEAYLNCNADELATKSIVSRNIQQQETSQYKAIYINNLPVFANHSKNIKETFHSIKYRQYLHQSFGWEHTTIKKYGGNR